MNRRVDWSMRLAEAVEDARILPFAYGVNDCCLWAAHCVDAMCDTSLASKIGSTFRYTNKEEADQAIADGGGLHALTERFLGKPVSARMAAPGDVVLARNGDGTVIIGICFGHAILAPGENGLLTLPYENGVMCWKV